MRRRLRSIWKAFLKIIISESTLTTGKGPHYLLFLPNTVQKVFFAFVESAPESALVFFKSKNLIPSDPSSSLAEFPKLPPILRQSRGEYWSHNRNPTYLLAHTSVPSCASSKKNCTRVWLYYTCSYSPYELLLCYTRYFKRGKQKIWLCHWNMSHVVYCTAGTTTVYGASK